MYPAFGILLLALAAVSGAAQALSGSGDLSAQPRSGFSGSDYSYGCRELGPFNDSGGDPALNYWIFEPTAAARPRPAAAPYVIWVHGYKLDVPDDYYRDLLTHVCRKGFPLIAPQYDSPTTPATRFFPNLVAVAGTKGFAFRRILADPSIYVKPLEDATGGFVTVAAGHSVGAEEAFALAAASHVPGAAISPIRYFVALEPVLTRSERYPAGSNLPPDAKFAIFVGGTDPHAGRQCMAATLWQSATRVPPSNKLFFVVNDVRRGDPALSGNHFWPLAAPNGALPRIARTNILDYAISFRYLTAAAACAGGDASGCAVLTEPDIPFERDSNAPRLITNPASLIQSDGPC